MPIKNVVYCLVALIVNTCAIYTAVVFAEATPEYISQFVSIDPIVLFLGLIVYTAVVVLFAFAWNCFLAFLFEFEWGKKGLYWLTRAPYWS